MRVICVTEPKYTSPIANKKSHIAFMPAVVIAAGIALSSLMESSHMPMMMHASDKVLHGAAYALLEIALMGAFLYLRCTRIDVYVLTGIVVMAYGALMEVLQYYCTVTRSAEWLDLLADFLGALVGMAVVVFIETMKSRYHERKHP